MLNPSREVTHVITLLRVLLILVFVVLGWFVLSYLAGVLGPILAALGIAYLLSPVLDWLVKRGLSRSVGAGLLLVVFVGTIVLLIIIAVPKIAEQVEDFVGDLPNKITTLSVWLKAKFGIEIPKDWQEGLKKLDFETTSGPLEQLAKAALGGVFSVLAVLAEMLLIPVFSFYFLVDWPNLLHRIDHIVPPRRRATVRELAREIDRVIANWVRGQGIVTSILAVSYAIGFTIVGMPLSIPIGLLVGALTIIPFVGTFVGATIAALVTIAGGGSVGTLGGVGVVILALHLLEAGVLTPKIVGHRVGLSESGALLAVVAGGKLLGFVGVVLAVPIAATFAVFVRAAVRYYEHTAFFGRESDADVVITPAMALILPGVEWSPAVWADGHAERKEDRDSVIELAIPNAKDDWQIEPELGAAGAAPAAEPAAPEPPKQGDETP